MWSWNKHIMVNLYCDIPTESVSNKQSIFEQSLQPPLKVLSRKSRVTCCYAVIRFNDIIKCSRNENSDVLFVQFYTVLICFFSIKP